MLWVMGSEGRKERGQRPGTDFFGHSSTAGMVGYIWEAVPDGEKKGLSSSSSSLLSRAVHCSTSSLSVSPIISIFIHIFLHLCLDKSPSIFCITNHLVDRHHIVLHLQELLESLPPHVLLPTACHAEKWPTTTTTIIYPSSSHMHTNR